MIVTKSVNISKLTKSFAIKIIVKDYNLKGTSN